MHAAALAKRNATPSSEQLSNDGGDFATSHVCKAVAAVGCNDVVLFVDRMLDANRDGLLASREMTETADLLFLVQSICRHFHPTAKTDHC